MTGMKRLRPLTQRAALAFLLAISSSATICSASASPLRKPLRDGRPRRFDPQLRQPNEQLPQQQQQHSQQEHRQTQTRIIGGSRTNTHVPYFAHLEQGCGATLIHEDVLLSAAHCANDDNPFARRVWLGGTVLYNGLVRTSVRDVVHPLYGMSATSVVFDYMIVKLNATALASEDLEWVFDVDKIPPAKPGLAVLPVNRQYDNPHANQTLVTLGFGKTDPLQYGLYPYLEYVGVEAVDMDQCVALYGDNGAVQPKSMICAGDVLNGGKDACQGDSGGPLVDFENNVVVGVTSWGEGCGLKQYPGIYSRVSLVAAWIDDQICRLSCHPPATCDPDILHPCATTQRDGPLALTLSVLHDAYPAETAFTFTKLKTEEQLYYQPYNAYPNQNGQPDAQPILVERTWTGLYGGTFHLLMSDKGRDGVCCMFGSGKMQIRNANTKQVLWSRNGDFGPDLDVLLTLADNGKVLNVQQGGNSVSLTPPSAPTALDNGGNSYVDDPLFPGPFPSANATHAVTINVKLDEYADETSWALERWVPPPTNDTGAWNDTVLVARDDDGLNGWDAVVNAVTYSQQGDANTLKSYQQVNLVPGLYKFRIQDRANDGTCCLFGNGWMTLTNGTRATGVAASKSTTLDERPGTVIWRHSGDFGGLLTAYFLINNQGFAVFMNHSDMQGMYQATVAALADRTKEESQSMQPSVIPTSAPSPIPTRILGGMLPVVDLGNGDAEEMMVVVRYDNYPNENWWQLTLVATSEIVVQGFGDQGVVPGSVVAQHIVGMPRGQYLFDIWDAKGDGMCCNFGAGWVNVTNAVSGDLMYSSSGEFGDHAFASLSLGRQ